MDTLNLDKAPPMPMGAKKLPPDSTSTGPMGGSPTMMGLQYLSDAKKALLGIVSVFPELTNIISPTVTDLEQLVTKALSDKMAGLPPGGMGGPVPAPMSPPPAPTGASGAGPMGM